MKLEDFTLMAINNLIEETTFKLPLMIELIPFILQNIDEKTDAKIVKYFKGTDIKNSISRNDFLLYIVESINSDSNILKNLYKIYNYYFKIRTALSNKNLDDVKYLIKQYYDSYLGLINDMAISVLNENKRIKSFIHKQIDNLDEFRDCINQIF